MTSLELKSFIHQTIENIDDERFLEALKVLIETKFSSEIVLEDWELKAIEESEKQFETGQFLSREDADEQIEDWLKSKNG